MSSGSKAKANNQSSGVQAPECIAIMGATATGKSSLAIELAMKIGGEIISMDSRQVYRGMDIGTAKVSLEERNIMRHHLIDVLDPDEPNSAGWHAQKALEALKDIKARGKVPILVGGTGLYFRALFYGLINLDTDRELLEQAREEFRKKTTDELYGDLMKCDPTRAKDISPKDRMRITRTLEIFATTGKTMSEHLSSQERSEKIRAIKLVLSMDRMELRATIAERTREMFARGWIAEVESLLASGYAPSSPGMNSLGYKQIAHALYRGDNPNEQVDRIITLTRQYAKRQETFFRCEREAIWFDVRDKNFREKIEDLVRKRFDFKNYLT